MSRSKWKVVVLEPTEKGRIIYLGLSCFSLTLLVQHICRAHSSLALACDQVTINSLLNSRRIFTGKVSFF